MAVMGVYLDEIDPTQFFVSPRRNYVKGKFEEPYFVVNYGKPEQNFVFIIRDARTNTGVRIRPDVKRPSASIALSLNDETVRLIEEKIHKPVLELIYKHKDKIFKEAALSKLTSLDRLEFAFPKLYAPGRENPNKPGETYSASIWADVDLTMTADKQPIPDPILCIIEDVKTTPYAYTTMAGKNLKEVAIEWQKIRFKTESDMRHRLAARVILVDDVARPPINTPRRQLEQQKQHQAAAAPAAKPADAKRAAPTDATAAAPASAAAAPEAAPPAAKKART